MSRSATPATRNEATTRLKPPKMTTSAELPIGTAIRGSRKRLRTVADGCARERNVERTHPQPPDPQSETGTLATHSGKTRKPDEVSTTGPHSASRHQPDAGANQNQERTTKDVQLVMVHKQKWCQCSFL